MGTKKSLPNIARTLVGAFVGAAVAMLCWVALFLLAAFDDANPNWKGILISASALLPLVCVTGGAIACRAYQNRINYVVANVGLTILATMLCIAAIATLLTPPIWLCVILVIPVFFGLAYLEQHFVSAIVNQLVDRVAGPPADTAG